MVRPITGKALFSHSTVSLNSHDRFADGRLLSRLFSRAANFLYGFANTNPKPMCNPEILLFPPEIKQVLSSRPCAVHDPHKTPKILKICVRLHVVRVASK